MFGVILLLLMALPFIELIVILQVHEYIGLAQTIAIILTTAVFGAWFVRQEGIRVLNRIQEKMTAGSIPGKELLDGALILFAGALLLTPGFITDAVGLFLLVPPTRAIARSLLTRYFKSRIVVQTSGFRSSSSQDDIIDADFRDVTSGPTGLPGNLDNPPKEENS